ncbi:nuclear pore protein 84/107 [Lasiosphaeris hirsuta]|uniref:Nuclear pore complex protein n=1 Tax=Lasiosphaeris hirsuta TaxID=260670 RepID=A0AA40BAQ0_9PEZI|nr:nuclear pore protein 84/107 [Lasiosphaeris hirsuta]
MAPAFDLPVASDNSSPSAQSPAQGPSYDEMAALEATYQEANFTVSDEVDFFAEELDRYHVNSEGSPIEERAQVFRLVDSYYTYTRNKADRLHERQSNQRSRQSQRWQRGASADMDIDEIDGGVELVSPETLRRVEEEAQTWDLLRRMLPLRYRGPSVPQLNATDDSPTQSRKQWWNDFMISDSLARERKVVLEWLQNSASHGPPIDEVVSELQQNAERGDILAHGWLHTRHKIKLQKSVNGYQGVLDPNDAGAAHAHLGSNTLITQLDPDAITRQARKAEPEDEFFERAIWLGCFEMLRRGCTMDEIRDWCSVRTELWRAATIAPLPLSNPDDEDQADFDPRSLILWRRMCFAAAQDGGTSAYDRAVYGLLSGDLGSVEKVCKTWDDYLFASYNAILRSQFDSFLVKRAGVDASKIAGQFPVFDTTVHKTEPTTASKRLIGSLEFKPETKKEALRTAKVLQGAIVAKELDQHMYTQGYMLSKHANQKQKSKLIPESAFYGRLDNSNPEKYFDLSDHSSLRVLAHVLIIVNTLDQLGGSKPTENSGIDRQAVQENIIAGYISYLRLSNLEEMIPLYCSKLSKPRLYEALSRNLSHVVAEEARRAQLTIMNNLKLDVAEFARTQPQIYLADVDEKSVRCEAKGKFKILNSGPASVKYGRIVKPDFFGEDSEYVDPEDELIIRSLEWLLLVDGLFVETCTYVIRAYKYFLKRTRLRAARALFTRVPGRNIVHKKTPIPVRPSDEDASPGWFEEFTEGKMPDEYLEKCGAGLEQLTTMVKNMWELECLVRTLDSIETLSSLAGLTREDSKNSRELWQHTSQEVRKVKASMQPVLRGWLLTTNEVDPDFRELRGAYIPETVLGYISSLHFAGACISRDHLLEAMDLASVIAEKGSDLGYEFVLAGRMAELIESFASSSKALAISANEKKGSQTNSKKLKEMGWSRELWSIKP